MREKQPPSHRARFDPKTVPSIKASSSPDEQFIATIGDRLDFKDKDVLVVGPGHSNVLSLAKRHPTARFTAVDVEDGVLNDQGTIFGDLPNVQVLNADITSKKGREILGGRTFDHVICTNVISRDRGDAYPLINDQAKSADMIAAIVSLKNERPGSLIVSEFEESRPTRTLNALKAGGRTIASVEDGLPTLEGPHATLITVGGLTA